MTGKKREPLQVLDLQNTLSDRGGRRVAEIAASDPVGDACRAIRGGHVDGNGATLDAGARGGGENLNVVVTGDFGASEDGDPPVSLVKRGGGEKDVGEIEPKSLD